VAKDIGLLCMIAMSGTSSNLFACLLDNGVIHDKKQHGAGFDLRGPQELLQSGLGHLPQGPDVWSEESGEAGQRPMNK
jgi:hypothetical protein